MCIEVVFFYIFPVTKEMFYISYIYFLHIRVLTFIVSFYSTISRGWNHIYHNYDTKVEKDTLINEDDAHKVVFCTFSDLSGDFLHVINPHESLSSLSQNAFTFFALKLS